jgi:putative ABC transport system permease protein
MSLALTEMRRAKGRFALLAGAVGLLVFLILFQQALLGGLITQFIGAIRNQNAPVLLYGADARKNLEGSRVPPNVIPLAAQVDGVKEVAPIYEATFSVHPGVGTQDLIDATVFGITPGGPGTPTTLRSGRLPTASNEAIGSANNEDQGISLGRRIRVEPSGTEITVVGIATDIRFSASPTLFVDTDTFVALRTAANPDAAAVLPSAAGVMLAPGADAEAVVRKLNGIAGVEALTRTDAENNAPGVSAVRSSFTVILGLFYVVVPLVAGLFFLILTFQKADSLTLLRAIGGPPRQLVRNLLIQVAIVVAGGVAIATLLLWGASQGTRTIGVTVDPVAVGVTGGIVLTLCLVAALASVRRVLAIDPIDATTGQDVLA